MITEGKPIHKSGKDLKVGDVIDTWWSPNRDTITDLKPYRGTYSWEGVRMASFAILKTGMTIFPDEDFIVFGTLYPDNRK